MLSVRRVWDNRYDDRLVGLSAGAWASANDHALTMWHDGEPGPPLVSESPLPGALEWFAGAKLVGWGPSIVDPGDAGTLLRIERLVELIVPEVGAENRRHYSVEVGAAGAEGRRVVALVRSRPPRVREHRARLLSGPASRLAVYEVGSGQVEATLGDDLPQVTAVSWGDGPLLLATSGEVIEVDERTWEVARRKLPTPNAPRALAVDPDGQVAAAMSDGTITTWSGAAPPRQPWLAHSGPARSVAWSTSGLLASGGEDGMLRVWSSAAAVADELAVGQEGKQEGVEAVAWLDETHLIAKVGGQAGRLALVERTA